MDKQRHPYTTKESQPPHTSFIARMRANSSTVAKISVAGFAFLAGITFILVCVYAIIPGMINNAASKMDHRFAQTMYEKTLRHQSPAATVQPVFEQPDGTLAPPEPRSCFSSVLSDNPDVVGRISITPLGIAYLVTQSGDNAHYLVTGYDGTESASGTIFLDYRCNAHTRPLSGHYIIYGHNMKNGTMFHNLAEYKNADIFDDCRVIRFDTLYEDLEWEVFSAYVTDTNFYFIDTDFADKQEWDDFLDTIQLKSMFDTDVSLSSDDVILTLVTCSYEFDDARFVVHARLIS